MKKELARQYAHARPALWFFLHMFTVGCIVAAVIHHQRTALREKLESEGAVGFAGNPLGVAQTNYVVIRK